MKTSVALAAVLALLGAAPAQAAPDLTLSAGHARATFLRATAPNTTLYTGTLTLTVANRGRSHRRQRGHRQRHAARGAVGPDQQPGRGRRAGRRLRTGLDLHRHALYPR